MRKIAISIAGLSALGALALATPAFADTQPVNQGVAASVTIGETLTATGFSSTVTFPGSTPGQTTTAVNAEQFSVTTNHNSGATVSIKNENGGFRESPGQPDRITNNAVSILTSTGPKQLPNDGTTLLESVPAGNHAYTHSWALAVPSSLTFSGSLTANYTLSVVANA